MKRKKLKKFFKDKLFNLYQEGHGKSKQKGIHNETPYIHSHSTHKTYQSQCAHFAEFCYAQGIKYPGEEKALIVPYIEHLKASGKSPFTIYTAACALAKVYGCSTEDFGITFPKRERVSIRRSRLIAKRDTTFSEENNRALIEFCRSTGLRRSELTALRGSDLRVNGDKVFVHVKQGKGGKSRNVEVIGDVKGVVKIMKEAGNGLAFPAGIPSHMDVHSYRSQYACEYYRKYARPLKNIPQEDKYICRKDKAGTVYDKKAMAKTSLQLGHNRISVIAGNYLYNL